MQDNRLMLINYYCMGIGLSGYVITFIIRFVQNNCSFMPNDNLR